MEPGHEDREYSSDQRERTPCQDEPQWSPVMKTGNTNMRVSFLTKTARLNGARS